jgi:hypothetical protein
MSSGPGRRRLVWLMTAGLVDSLCLSVAWTVLMLEVVEAYGLAAAGMCSAAMLVGVALSAPATSRMAGVLDGRRLLRAAAAMEAVLRLGVFALLLSEAPVWLLALCVSAMNVTAWTGYAAMRAEVAAVSDGPAALTWYGTVVAAVEAAGIALAALLPAGAGGTQPDAVLLAVTAAYVLALLPTVVVAGGSPVPRAARTPVPAQRPRRPAVSGPTLAGVLLMFAASAPPLLAVALAAQLHGRSAVALAAVAFTLGSLAAPALAAWVQRRHANHVTAWAACAVGMVAGWVFAPLHVAVLCCAQALAGLCMTTLEGLLDATAARRQPDQVTGALARATAGRALGSAAGTAVLPLLVAQAGLPATMAVVTLALLAVSAGTHLARAAGTARVGAVGREPEPTLVP